MKQHASSLALSYIAKATNHALRAKKTALTGVVMAAALTSAPALANLTGGIKGKVSTPAAQQSLLFLSP